NELALSVMRTAGELERIAYEFVLDAAADGLRYVEVRYSPLLHRPALTLAQAIEAPLAGIKRGAAETGTKVGVIVCGIRTRAPAESLELARVAAGYRTAGVVAFDLAGAERPFKRYLDQGVVVTLNTDGRLVDGVSLTDEYFLAQSVLGLTKADLARVVLNACESAFLPEFEKVALVSRVQSELEALS